MKGSSLLLGNNLAGDKLLVNPHVSSLPNVLSDTEMQDIPGLYPACAVTRAMAKKHLTTSQDIYLNNNTKNDMQSLPSSSSIGDDTFITHLDELSEDTVMGGTQGTPTQLEMSMNGNTSLTEQLMRAQEADPELEVLFHSVLDATEANKVPSCFYKKQGILMRRWRPCTTPSNEE